MVTVNAMVSHDVRVPPGPSEPYDPADDLFAWLRDNFLRYGDIYKASVFGGDVYVVSGPQYCERILRENWKNYPRKGQVVKRISLLLGNGLIASNGAFWASQRRMIQPNFARESIRKLMNMIVAVNHDLLQAWTQAAACGQSVNVTQDLSVLTLQITLTAIFGDDYQVAAPHFSVLAQGGERNLRFAQALRLSAKAIQELADRRRAAGLEADDFMGRMMRARHRDTGAPMADAQLAREVMTLAVAGHETTAGLLNWLWYLLSRRPDVQRRLTEEFARLPFGEAPAADRLPAYTYTRQVIDEALRLYPPLWLMTRKALADDRLGAFHIPAGAEIYISPYLIQRSPDLWPSPDAFDPDRMASGTATDRAGLALCPFGAGPRNCIGEPLARAEIQIHLMMFARRLRIVYQEAAAPKIAAGMNLLSKDDFIMTPTLTTALQPR